MSEMKLTLEVLSDTLGVCKLDTKQAIPPWAYQGGGVSITKTKEELFAISTYNTDYILVKAKDFDCAVNALRNDGHKIIE